MKTIELEDDDYNTLIELVTELKNQPNHYQAPPYYWEPGSERLIPNLNGEGNIIKLVCNGDEIDIEETFEKDEINRFMFLENNNYDENLKYDELTQKQKDEFQEYLVDNCDCDVYTYDYQYETEHNPSLFLSDVQNFIEHNKHHLGRNPITYANTIWRMPKMEKLVNIIYNIKIRE